MTEALNGTRASVDATQSCTTVAGLSIRKPDARSLKPMATRVHGPFAVGRPG